MAKRKTTKPSSSAQLRAAQVEFVEAFDELHINFRRMSDSMGQPKVDVSGGLERLRMRPGAEQRKECSLDIQGGTGAIIRALSDGRPMDIDNIAPGRRYFVEDPMCLGDVVRAADRLRQACRAVRAAENRIKMEQTK